MMRVAGGYTFGTRIIAAFLVKDMDNDNTHYERTAAGAWLYSWVTEASIWAGRHKAVYWILNLTWGIIMTLIGYLAALCLFMAGKRPKAYEKIHYQAVGKSWGGLTLGTSVFVDSSENAYTLTHEYGHTHQNAVLGPFFIFLVAIPSAVRYWHRKIKKTTEPSYYAIWFEGSASDIGEELTKE